MNPGTRIIGSIGNILSDDRQVYFTDKSVILVKTSWRTFRLKMLGNAHVMFPTDWNNMGDITQILGDINKRKEAEIPIEHVHLIDLTPPKRGLILKGKHGLIRFWLVNGSFIDVKIDIECPQEDFNKIYQLLNTIFPGKTRIIQQ